MRLKLKVRARTVERTVELTGQASYTIGRVDADLILMDLACSRRHALFFEDSQGQVRLKDLESAQGTQVNGKLVSDCPLRLGDTVRVGEVEIVVLELGLSPPVRLAPAAEASSVEETAPKDNVIVVNEWPRHYRALKQERLKGGTDPQNDLHPKRPARLVDLFKGRGGHKK